VPYDGLGWPYGLELGGVDDGSTEQTLAVEEMPML
jgi:hypothetical protein